MFAPTFTSVFTTTVTDTLMLTQKAACQRITQGLCYPGASLSTLCGLQPVHSPSDSRNRLRPSFNYSWLTLSLCGWGLKGQFTYFLCEAAQTACATFHESAVFTQGNDALPVWLWKRCDDISSCFSSFLKSGQIEISLSAAGSAKALGRELLLLTKVCLSAIISAGSHFTSKSSPLLFFLTSRQKRVEHLLQTFLCSAVSALSVS